MKERLFMKRTVMGVIVFSGLLVGQLDAHTCNAAAIQRKDQVKSSNPPTCAPPVTEACDERVIVEWGMSLNGKYPGKISHWTSGTVEESISEKEYAWSECGVSMAFVTEDADIGGTFQLTVNWNNAGFSYTTPTTESITLTGQMTMEETNHRYRWVRWTKSAKATLSGITRTYLENGSAATAEEDSDSNSVVIATGVYYIAECCQ